MPPRTKEQITNVVITTIATLFILFGTGAWALKENTADHRADIEALTALQQRTLDAVCDQADKKPRTCSSAPAHGVRFPPAFAPRSTLSAGVFPYVP